MSSQTGNNARECSIKSIVEEGFFFEIPPYQRLYEWEKEQIETLLEDVRKACFNANGEPQNKIYFIGNVVVSEENGEYILIDGQQRLTTLFLIGICLASKEEQEYQKWGDFVKSDKKLRISMPLRENEEKWLSELIDKGKKFRENLKSSPSVHKKIFEGLVVIQNWFEQNSQISIKKFSDFLYHNVCFALVKLAENTDLNQFFVRMNNRGKQLEKHEILKARLLSVIKDEADRKKYAKIWDLCSDMDKYIFALESDRKTFCQVVGRNNKNEPIKETLQDIHGKKLYEIAEEFKNPNNLCISDENKQSKTELFEIIKDCTPQEIKEQSKDATYHSIVDFSTFLLHIFKLFVMEKKREINVSIEKDKLLKIMWDDDGREEFWRENSNAKDFIKQLLLYRFAFDYFVIKQKVGDSSYVIDWNYIKDNKSGRMLFEDNKLTNDDLKNLVMIQNYLRVARAGERQNYHHWLTYMLQEIYKFLFCCKDEIGQGKLKVFIGESVKNLEVLDTNLAIIQKTSNKDSNNALLEQANESLNKLELKSLEALEDQWVQENLNQGTGTPHYWFYRLEYYLWKWKDNLGEYANNIKVDDCFKNNADNYRFRGLNSIEHIQPQSKKNEWEQWGENKKCEIDDFGNLALISQSFNSSLSNQDMEKKWIDIRKNKDVESLKMCLAYASVGGKYEDWNPQKALDHQKEMLKVLKASLGIDVKSEERPLSSQTSQTGHKKSY